MDDCGVQDCQGEGELTIVACWTCQGVGGFGVRMNMSMGVLDCQGVGEWTIEACRTCQGWDASECAWTCLWACWGTVNLSAHGTDIST